MISEAQLTWDGAITGQVVLCGIRNQPYLPSSRRGWEVDWEEEAGGAEEERDLWYVK